MLTLGLVVLGFNKQLDLQILFEEIGRWMADHYGWYDQRREVQFLFVGIFFALLAATTVVLLIIRERLPELGFTLMGVELILAFIALRAATLEHVRMIPPHPWVPVPGRAVLEFSGIVIAGAGAWHWLRRH